MADLIDAIGEAPFETRLHQLLSELCQTDHFGVFRLNQADAQILATDPTELGQERLATYRSHGMWRLDPLLHRALTRCDQGSSYFLQADMRLDVHPRSRALLYSTIRDRYLVYGNRGGARYGLSVMSSTDAPQAPPSGIAALQDCAGLLLSVLAKHYERMSAGRHVVRRSLCSVADIERHIVAHAVLPARERAVCARLLYGMMTPGIAIDLGIGEESVKTYRKRLHRRLNVAGQRELLMWYMELGSPAPASMSAV
jgi:DNA-binding CsgD family transcriptional regulator